MYLFYSFEKTKDGFMLNICVVAVFCIYQQTWHLSHIHLISRKLPLSYLLFEFYVW